MSERYIVDLPIHPASADVAGAPAQMIEHYVRSVGRPEGIASYTTNSPLSGDGWQGIDGAVADLEAKLPGAFWHVAKGRLSAKEPLFAAGIFFGEQELGIAETDISPAEAIRLATARALSGKRGGK